MDFAAIWQQIKDYFTGNYISIIKFFALLIIGIIIIKIVCAIFKGILGRTKMEKIAQNFLLAIIRFLLWLVLILILLSVIGLEISGFLTAVSAVVLAIGMALQSNIANLANGIVIVSTHMFKKGDFISVAGSDGSIVEINFLFTTLLTPDNKRITLPNSMIVNNAVVNAGANPKRRVDFTFSVAYESDVEKVKQTVVAVMKSNGCVYLDPEPFCKLKVLNTSSLDFFANCWVDSADYWNVYYYVIENVYNEFKKNGITVPFTQYEIRTRTEKVKMPFNPAPLPTRVEKVRKEDKTVLEEIVEKAKEEKQKIKTEQKARKAAKKSAKEKKANSAKKS
ncbi:MAG: mechanosensitive ion channel family protein [Clostridia bacterium]|nr:mechanosensitive ion channel family protein [Clostridia bacterium]